MEHNLRHRSSNKAWQLYRTGPAEQISKFGGRSTSFDVKLWGLGGEERWVGLWTLKMVYLVPTQYFLIQLQLINHFLKQFNKRERSQYQKGVTVHSSIIIFACFIYFKSLSVFSLRLFRTFLYSLSRNGAMFQTVLTFELPKLTFSCCDGCGFTSRSLQIGTISFIMLCNILTLKCENMERLARKFWLFSSFRNF